MAESRIELEKRVFRKMVSIYCKGHKHRKTPCPQCSEVIAYADLRLSRCKFGENKTFCSRCTVHCFKQDMRDRVQAIMRYSGPRMLLHHPIMAMKHMSKH